MSFSRKELFEKINKNKHYVKDDYIKNGINAIEDAISDANIDDNFYNEYYKLKRMIELQKTFDNSIMLGIVASLVVSLAIKAFEDVGFICYLLVLALGTIVGIVITIHSHNKQNCILQPYLLKIMEEKIDAHIKNSKNLMLEVPNSNTDSLDTSVSNEEESTESLILQNNIEEPIYNPKTVEDIITDATERIDNSNSKLPEKNPLIKDLDL